LERAKKIYNRKLIVALIKQVTPIGMDNLRKVQVQGKVILSDPAIKNYTILITFGFLGTSNMEKKKCTTCQKIKPVSKFYKRFYMTKKRGRVKICQSECKACSIEKSKKRYVYNWKRNKTRNLNQSFGMTYEEYEYMVNSQNNVCAICGNPELSKSKKVLAVDHCHTTGKVRGLLCNKCNTALGAFGDDIDVMASAISYLINSRLKKVS